jgi:hypothetical protein
VEKASVPFHLRQSRAAILFFSQEKKQKKRGRSRAAARNDMQIEPRIIFHVKRLSPKVQSTTTTDKEMLNI